MENRSPGGGADPGGGGGGGTVPRGAPIEETVKAEKDATATSEISATASAPMRLPPTEVVTTAAAVKDEDVAMADAPELPAAKQEPSEDDSSSLLEKKVDSTQSSAPAVEMQSSVDGATNPMTTPPVPVPNSADSARTPPLSFPKMPSQNKTQAPNLPQYQENGQPGKIHTDDHESPRDVTPPPTTSLPDNQDMLEFATPTQSSRDFRNIILAAQSAQSTNMFMQDSVPPSPVVEPGALHELGDIHTPNRRRSSAAAIGGIAGLEELIHRKEGDGQSRFDQLIQATKIEGESGEKPTPVVDAFLRLDFEDGNVYYIRNPSVVFGRAEGASAGYYSHVGPDGSTIIETGPTGFGTTTSSGLTSIRREKKKRRKKKNEFDLMRKTKSSTSDSCVATPGSSRRGSEFALPCFRDPFGLDDIFGTGEPVIHLPLSNSSLGDNAPAPPRKNISRRHARLFYNTPKRRFELEIMGKNGAFVDEEYVTAGSTIVVEEKGMKVQIGGISFNVVIPELPHIEDITPATKPIGGKGKMSFSFHDENGNEVSTNFSGEDDDVAMEDEDEEIGSDEESENGSREQSEDDEADDEDNEAEDEADSAEETVIKDPDSSELSSMEEVSARPSPEPVSKRGRGRPKKSIADIQRRERELQRDREKIRVLQRQLKEKEKEKAQAEAEAAKREREDQRAHKREREKEKEREKERDKEKEKLRDEQKKKKATDLQRQKEARQKEKELAKLAKEKEREREKERKKQAKLHLPTGTPKKEEGKLYLPATTKNLAQQQESKPGTMLSLQASSSTDSTPGSQLQTQPQQTQQQFAQQLQQPQHQTQAQPQYQTQPQTYTPAPSVIDPALYETSASPMTSARQDHPYTQTPLPEKQKKEKAPAKQKKLRSPSPEVKESDIPPEALQKPNISYVVMIHEAILNSQERMLSLPQIYKTIETKYPYYKFKVTTNGWQSSVRHNLGQHKAFYKVDRAGKGWLWGVVDGISIEKEKKGSAAKQAIPVGYDMSAMHNGQRAMQHPNGQMAGQQTGAVPQAYQQQPVYHNATNGVAQQQYQTNQEGMAPHQPMQQPNAYPQQVPPMPSYMPQKQPQQSASQPNHRAFEAPIPRPVASGPSQSQTSEQKPDAKQVIALLSKIIAQRQDQSSTDTNANKGLEQLKEFLNQLVSGRANPAALETVASLVNSYKQPVASKALASSTPPQSSAASPPPPASVAGTIAQAPPKLPAQATVSSPPPPPPVQGQTAGKAPAKAPATKVTLANLHEHIKTMSPEERAKWTKKLLELKQQKAAAAAAAKSPTPPQPAVDKAPAPAVKAPSGLGAGKHPQKMTSEMVQQILKLRANHVQKRPAPPAGEGEQQGPAEKKVDVGAGKE